MDKSVMRVLTDAVQRAQRELDGAKTTTEKHYARGELRRARENLASLGPGVLDDFDKGVNSGKLPKNLSDL